MMASWHARALPAYDTMQVRRFLDQLCKAVDFTVLIAGDHDGR